MATYPCFAIPANRTDLNAPGLPPIVRAVEAHRKALDAKAALGDEWEGGWPSEAWLALDDAESEAFKAVLVAPVSSSADAAAFVAHLRPLVALGESRHPILNDCGDEACAVTVRVLDVFAAVLAAGSS